MKVSPGSIESMTGYGEARCKLGSLSLICRVKSLNHRFLDVKVRLPRSDMSSLDLVIRKKLAEVFKRGAIELTLSVETAAGSTENLINTELAKSYHKSAASLARSLGKSAKGAAKNSLSLDTLLRLPGVVGGTGNGHGDDALTSLEDGQILEKAVEPAIAALKNARCAEGKSLSKHLIALLDEMDHHVEEIRRQEQPEKERARQLITERAQETLKLLSAISPGTAKSEEFSARLREEAVFWIERRDFDEERVRLSMHLKDFRAHIAKPIELTGRKLEFIQQEILREINTLGTKAQSPAITTHTIELKTILERVREQLANVS